MMSWSLQLRHGDLVLNGTSLGTVKGPTKLQQDLTCAILERMGSDHMHPEFGSLIDGGRLTDGTHVPSLLGQTLDAKQTRRVAQAIQSELNRIFRQYQKKQLNRAQADQLTYAKPTLSPDEILEAVEHFELTQIGDTIIASVTLRTVSNPIKLTLPLSEAAVNE